MTTAPTRPPVITLTTDFGTSDPYVGLMKGVILSIAPWAQVIDITHEIPPQDVTAAALCLESLLGSNRNNSDRENTTQGFFPAGAVHLAVVDPGVGTRRRALAIQTGNEIWVGPDNGIFTAVFDGLPNQPKIIELNNPAYHLPSVSATFHGRDVFAPVAAHLANGVPFENLGTPLQEITQLQLPRPTQIDGTWTLHVLRVDRFGNLITDLKRHDLKQWIPGVDWNQTTVQVGTTRIHGISTTYSAVAPGQPVAYFGSTDRLEIAINQGHAATSLRTATGASIKLQLPSQPEHIPAKYDNTTSR